jgi:tetratricopeptide (TPR) repeat protein
MNGLFTDSPYFNEYETCLRQLHRLIAEGKGNTEEADEVRDAMDTPWLHLTDAEVARLDGLSADLYMLQDREVFEPSDGRSKIQIGQAIYTALNQEKWEEALALMHKPNWIPRDRIAAIRAVVYDELGQSETSLLFWDYAISRQPQNYMYLALHLHTLIEATKSDEVIGRALLYLEDTTCKLPLRLFASNVVAKTANRLVYPQPAYEKVASILASILEHPLPAIISSELKALGFRTLGYCLVLLGRYDEALAAYKTAISLDNSEVLRGLIDHFPRTIEDKEDLRSGLLNNSIEELRSQKRSLYSQLQQAA